MSSLYQIARTPHSIMVKYNKEEPIRVLLIHFVQKDTTLRQAEEDQEEFKGLCLALEWIVSNEVQVKIREIHSASYIGSGKASEIAALAQSLDVDICAFDTELSPTQQRNLETILELPVVDRPGLIIEIFGDRAQTNEAKVQVEKARLGYIMPRLTSSYTALSRQRGGAKGNRGKGETQLELDRRKISDRMALNRKKLDEIEDRRTLNRKSRTKNNIPTVALVGYTNAGKSLLHKVLTGELEGRDKNMLFATLDPHTRECKLPNSLKVLCTDTVGFIRRLPHALIDAFKATLEEVIIADLLIEVIDASSPYMLEHFEATNLVLGELGAQQIPKIIVLNKIDLIEENTWNFWKAQQHYVVLEISAKTGAGIDELKSEIESCLSKLFKTGYIDLPFDSGQIMAYLSSQGAVLEKIIQEDNIRVKIKYADELKNKLSHLGFAIHD